MPSSGMWLRVGLVRTYVLPKRRFLDELDSAICVKVMPQQLEAHRIACTRISASQQTHQTFGAELSTKPMKAEKYDILVCFF
jgi:hypothetical protein